LQERVAEKQADSLRLLVEVAGHGAFVAAFGDRAEIVLASPQSSISEFHGAPVPGGLSFARPKSPWWSPSIEGWCTQNRSPGVNAPRGAGRWAGIRGGVARRAMRGLQARMSGGPEHQGRLLAAGPGSHHP
jgi:hypothetical protein